MQTTVKNLPQADVILSGEPREWEAVEYVFDTAAAGQPRGMIAVGRLVSEEPGMRACAAWLRTHRHRSAGGSHCRRRSLLEDPRMTAHDAVRRSRIKAQLASQGIAWREGGRDTFKAGKPETEVRGIATTGMSTFDVLRRAAKDGKNLVITHEPTFYNDRDVTTDLEADPVYLAKQRFVAEHDLVVWRFHDHAHAMRPDPLIAGSARALGWTQYASPSDPRALHRCRPRHSRELAAARRANGSAIARFGSSAIPR